MIVKPSRTGKVGHPFDFPYRTSRFTNGDIFSRISNLGYYFA
jgi:hypothetical protein